jgi:hypothetical protein
VFSIYFEQTGGFTGITITVQVDQHSVTREESDEILMLIRNADFFNFHPQAENKNHPADRLLYIIDVDVEGRRHSVTVYDYQVTEQLKPLVGYLKNRARGAKK